MTSRVSLRIAFILAAGFAALPAAAQIRAPDCDAIAAWAAGYQRGAQWKPNTFGTGNWVPPLLVEPSTAQLFGKPLLEWSVEEAGEVTQIMVACEREFQQARQLEKRNAVSTMRGWVRNNATAMLRAITTAREAVPAQLTALDAAPASPQLLRFYAALARAGNSQQTFNAAGQAAGQLQGEPQQQARALLAALRDMPQAEIGPAVAETANARAAAMRGAVREGIIADFGRLQATPQSLVRLAQAPQQVRQQFAGALANEDFAAIDQAIAARRAAIGTEAEADIIKALAALTPGAGAFQEIDRYSNAQVLRVLPEANAAKVRAAADAQRKKAGDAVYADLRTKLAAMPQTQDSIDLIDADLLPGIARMPESVADQKARFVQLANERRATILAAVNRAERGALRGRVYEGGPYTLEFVDRTRVFMKMGTGQTSAGTYTEERDGRVVVTINNQATVLTREGRKLIGGPATFRRTK